MPRRCSYGHDLIQVQASLAEFREDRAHRLGEFIRGPDARSHAQRVIGA